MHNQQWTALAVMLLGAQSIVEAAGMAAANVTVGEGLEVISNITLDEPAPPAGLEVTLTSADPTRLLFSHEPQEKGSPTIVLHVRAGYRGGPDYYVQGFGKSGSVTYTLTAPGFASGAATVTLAPSGVVLTRSGMGVPSLLTTTRGRIPLVLHSGLLDSELNYLQPQPVAGGRSVKVVVASSNTMVGAVDPVTVTIEGGSASAAVEFHPLTAGETTLSLSVPQGFSAPAQFGSASAVVVMPGIAVTDDISIGHNLQAHGTISLGEPAPAGGVIVSLTSSDPSKLLLSTAPDKLGSDCINLTLQSGSVSAPYYLQALAGDGIVTYSATAEGFRTRAGTIALTPSGLVMGGPQGPPDEAELLSKEIAEGPHGFVANLAAGVSTVVTVYSVQLDPVTLRGADLTVQPVRPGIVIPVDLSNSNPAAGGVKDLRMEIRTGSSSAVTSFTPAGVGVTAVSVGTPVGYTKAGNSTSLTVIVKD